MNESLFSYETMSFRTRFGKEAKGNSEMAYCSKGGDGYPPDNCDQNLIKLFVCIFIYFFVFRLN